MGMAVFLLLGNIYGLYWPSESFNTESAAIKGIIIVLMIITADAIRRIEARLKQLEDNQNK